MAELKTKPNTLPVDTYLSTLTKEKKEEATTLIDMMEKITSSPATMWGSTIIGFGQKVFYYASGRNITYFLLGFSMRKHAITLYLTISTNQKSFDRLGPHTKGVGCLYIKKLADIQLNELHRILKESYDEAMKA